MSWPIPTAEEVLARIIHRETGFLIIDKPPGLVSAGPPRQIFGEAAPRQSMESLLVQALGRQVWAVHQLDRLTSGLNLFALKSSLVAPLAERLKTPGGKRYLALVHGHPRAPQAIDAPLSAALNPRTGKVHPAIANTTAAQHAPQARRRKDTPDPPGTARHALTHLLRTTAAEGPYAWVEVGLETGRQHQVRLHLAHIGHPLVGEPLHRDPPCHLHNRQALHAWRLTLPATSAFVALDLKAPIPADLIALSAALWAPLPG